VNRFVVSLSVVVVVGLWSAVPLGAQAAPPAPRSSDASAASAVSAASAASASAAAQAVAPVPATGTVAVRLLSPRGDRLRLAGATVELIGPSPVVDQATTDASGSATFGAVPAAPRYSVRVVPEQTGDYGLRAPVQLYGLAVQAGRTTTVDVTLPVGGTLVGRLIGPWPDPPAGLTVELYGNYVGTSLSTVTDPEGRYSFFGLPTDLYTATVVATPGGVPSVWRQDVVAETATAPAGHVFPAPRYVHSTYDLQVVVDEPDPDVAPGPDLDGAVVTITETTTGAVSTQVLGDESSRRKVAQFIVPSGRYTVGVETASHQRWWWAGQYVPEPLVVTAARAVPVVVTYGGERSTDVFMSPQSTTP
jgi:hypothetical protein